MPSSQGRGPGSNPHMLQLRVCTSQLKSLRASTKDSSCAQSLSRGWLFVIPWTLAHQAPLSMGFSRQDCHATTKRSCILQWRLKILHAVTKTQHNQIYIHTHTHTHTYFKKWLEHPWNTADFVLSISLWHLWTAINRGCLWNANGALLSYEAGALFNCRKREFWSSFSCLYRTFNTSLQGEKSRWVYNNFYYIIIITHHCV